MAKGEIIKTDEELAVLAQGGSVAARDELCERYLEGVKIISRGYYIAGGDREDVIQEGMMGLMKAISSYDASKDASFKTFSTVCIKRHIFDGIRASMRKKHAALNTSGALSDDDGGEVEIPSDVFDPEKIMLHEEEGIILDKRLKKMLTDREYRVLTAFLRGLTYEEIAAEVDINQKAVDNSLQSIRKKVRNGL